MKIIKVYLQNFRCFREITLNFDKKITIIVGVNGAGKTAILNAIAMSFGRLLTKLPNVKGISSSPNDLRITSKGRLASHMLCYIAALNEGQLIEWSIGRTRDKAIKTSNEILSHVAAQYVKGLKQLDKFIDEIIGAENEGVEYMMPLLVYYGTDRAVFNTPMRRRSFKTNFKRFDSLNGTLNPSANFKQAFEWFHAKENEEAREQKKRLSFEYVDSELETVRRAIRKILPEFTNPRTELRPLRFLVDLRLSDGIRTLDLNQLSDGYRTTLAMVLDLARRMAEANPPTEKHPEPLDSEAIILIDEIDLHLHPSWQQRIVHDLQQTFRNSQFIVTTHSPQVLTTLRKENIRVLACDEDGQWTANEPAISPLAHESGDALALIMDTHPRPELADIIPDLYAFERLARAGHASSDEARQIKARLDAAGFEFNASDQALFAFLAAKAEKSKVEAP